MDTDADEEASLLGRQHDEGIDTVWRVEVIADDSTVVGDTAMNDSDESKTWLNCSRKKLLLVWAPFQLIAIGLVAWTSKQGFTAIIQEASLNLDLFYAGICL